MLPVAPIIALALITGTAPADSPLLLDFTASWCGPCQATKPHVHELMRQGYPIRVVDIDHDADNLAQRYEVSVVPTFLVVERDGRELGRTTGAQTADGLVSFYEKSATKHVKRRPKEEEESAAVRAGVPYPWQTVVRIKVQITRPRTAIGYGSGTVVYSDERESIILTCAHIFHIEGARTQYPPARFPFPVLVDLFDGQLTGGDPPQVRTAEADLKAEVLDYDFVGDVALIRVRPGRALPASPVVAPSWKPSAGLKMTTVGCSQGKDATAWSTEVTRPRLVMQKGSDGSYEATECRFAPIQGRSGGGLFTMDGMLAGVCDFNDAPRGNGNVHRSPDYHGLYAAPATIHKLLDKHKLQVCYAPTRGRDADRTLLADTRRGSDSPKFRTQSPDPGMTMPDPEVLGVRLEPIRAADALATEKVARRETPWHAADGAPSESKEDAGDEPRTQPRRAVQVGMRLSPRQELELFPSETDDAADGDDRSTDTVRRQRGGDGWRAADSGR